MGRLGNIEDSHPLGWTLSMMSLWEFPGEYLVLAAKITKDPEYVFHAHAFTDTIDYPN